MKSKKFLAVFLSIAMVLTMIPMMSISALENTENTTVSYNSDVDYSDANNWVVREINPTKSADVFYVYPTIVSEGTVVDINDETMRKSAPKIYATQAGVLANDFNCYAPYYRQLAMDYEVKQKNVDGLVKLLKSNVTMEDIYSALDYYFTNINKNAERPFILAGHSQGSAILRAVLEDYMKNHPLYYKQMIATYALGMGFSSEWQSKNTHVKTAAGADDTGVLIAWNTEGPNATTSNFLLDTDTYLINPLNWKTDATYAGKEKNLGSLQNPENASTLVKPGENDAQIDLTRHSLICTTKDESFAYYYEHYPILGDKCLHTGDWGYYLENIRVNAVNRANKFAQKTNTGWQQSNGNWQYFENGTAVTGWKNNIPGWSGQWFYFDANGIMQTGWLSSGNEWYYLNSNGVMATGWKNDIPGYVGKWFYFEPVGGSESKMGQMYQNAFFAIESDRKIYGFEANGVMKANTWSYDTYKANSEVKVWVYYGADGARVTGWNFIGGKWYCFGGDGSMYAGCTTPDGYCVDDNGVWVA